MDIVSPDSSQDNPVEPEKKKYPPIYALDVLPYLPKRIHVEKPAEPEVCIEPAKVEPEPIATKKKYDLSKLPAKKICSDCKEEREIVFFLTSTLSKMFPNCKDCRNRQNRERYDPEIGLANNLRAFYGITLDDYDQMCLDQDDLCACCGEPEKTINKRTGEVQRLSVDHDHVTGRVRGLLCNHCNLEVARIESGKRRKLAMAYLERCNVD